jgi:hypothetical protein
VWPRKKKKSCREGLRETGRKEYLETALGDLETYVYNKIEAEVKLTK